MKLQIIEEHGHGSALRGMAYSFKDRAVPVDEWWDDTKKERALKRAPLLAPMDAGHNKFIRQIQLWIDIEAPRCWWSEFDTYKVGTVANSESTMHTLSKRSPTAEDFDIGTPEYIIEAFKLAWNDYQQHKSISILKKALPEGFLQRRMVTLNYANLRNIIEQRTGHRLDSWAKFIEQIMQQVQHPEYLEFKTK